MSKYDRTLVDDDRISQFIANLKERGRRDVPGIRALCLGERNFLKNAKYIKRGDDTRTPVKLSVTRRHKLITLYRNAIREAFGPNHPALEYLVLSDEEQDARNAAKRETVIARHHARRPVDADRHVAAALEILERHETAGAALDLAGALIAVTGRRPIEMLLTGDFRAVDAPDATLFEPSLRRRWTLQFSGQAKTRGAESAQNAPYEIPVLAPPSLILDAFKTLRRRYNCEGLTSQQVGDRAWKELGKYTKGRFTDRTGEAIKPSELRAAYATIAYEIYAPERQSWNAYAARILGHSAADLVTSFSYDQFYPVGSKRQYAREIRNATRETLALLQEQRRRESDPVKAGYLDEKIANVITRMEEE